MPKFKLGTTEKQDIRYEWDINIENVCGAQFAHERIEKFLDSAAVSVIDVDNICDAIESEWFINNVIAKQYKEVEIHARIIRIVTDSVVTTTVVEEC